MKDLMPGVRKPLTFAQKVKRSRTLILMCVPAILFFIAFHYLPLPGLYVAFVKYNYAKGIFGSKFVGLSNFKFLFTSGRLWDLTRNTVAYNFAFLMLDNIVAIFMAILINETAGAGSRKSRRPSCCFPTSSLPSSWACWSTTSSTTNTAS